MKKTRSRKTQIVLKGDLEERALKYATLVSMDIHDFTNQCVEGVVQALESENASYNIPIVRLGRLAQRKSWLDSDIIWKVIAFFSPKTYEEVQEVNRWHFHYLGELISKHQGPLTKEAWELYYEIAAEKNVARVAEEKRLAKLQSLKPKGK